MADYYVPEWETRAQYEESRVKEREYEQDQQLFATTRREVAGRVFYNCLINGVLCPSCRRRIKIRPATHCVVCECGKLLSLRE